MLYTAICDNHEKKIHGFYEYGTPLGGPYNVTGAPLVFVIIVKNSWFQQYKDCLKIAILILD